MTCGGKKLKIRPRKQNLWRFLFPVLNLLLFKPYFSKFDFVWSFQVLQHSEVLSDLYLRLRTMSIAIWCILITIFKEVNSMDWEKELRNPTCVQGRKYEYILHIVGVKVDYINRWTLDQRKLTFSNSFSSNILA